MDPAFVIESLSAGFGGKTVLRDVSLALPPRAVTAIIGPSGCGKSTFIRTLNRMHEVVDVAWVQGRVLHQGVDIFAPEVDPVLLRRQVGMVFQKPNPFPHLSVRENVLAGLRLTGRRAPDEAVVVEQALRQASLWEEVQDRLDAAAGGLSGGQQQRLCIARALAVQPSVILMDEPTSALDPIATRHVEDLIVSLKDRYTVALVTHSMQQARRVADHVAFFYLGELVEFGPTEALFERPREARTRAYLSGEFG